MIANIFVGICIVICIGASIFSWWVENGSDKKGEVKPEKNTEENTKEQNQNNNR